MSKHLTNEDLSAFMDGEHRRPEKVRRHLQQCADCAREHLALQKVSAHIQALPRCEATFGFAERVARAAKAEGSPRPRRRSMWLPLGTALAASIAAVVGFVSLYQPSVISPDSGMRANDAHPIVLTGMLGPDGSERDALGGSPDVAGDMQIASASEVASRPVPHEFFTGADYNASLVSLNVQEKETLLQLLGSTLIDEQMM